MTDVQTRPIVPLPEHLNHCGCPDASRGRHLTTCEPAKAHESTPLHERPDYVEGGRFAAVSWAYPLTLSARVMVDVDIDPHAYIAARLAEYESFTLDAGYEEWEKPMCFLYQRIEEDCDMFGSSFGYPRQESSVRTYMDEVDDRPRWTPEDTERLHASLWAPPEDQTPSLFDQGEKP